jgi:hypothetical protein
MPAAWQSQFRGILDKDLVRLDRRQTNGKLSQAAQ